MKKNAGQGAYYGNSVKSFAVIGIILAVGGAAGFWSSCQWLNAASGWQFIFACIAYILSMIPLLISFIYEVYAIYGHKQKRRRETQLKAAGIQP